MNMFIRLLNINYMKSVEFYFKQILDKKKFFKKEIAQYSLDPNNNNPQFKLYSKRILNKIDKMSAFVIDYYNRKYFIVLKKTNKDIYSNILSYL